MAEKRKSYEIYEADVTEAGEIVLRPEKGSISEEELEERDALFSNYALLIEYEKWDEDSTTHDDCASTDNLVYEGTHVRRLHAKENVSYLLRVRDNVCGAVFHVWEKDGSVSLYPFLFIGADETRPEKMHLIRGRENRRYYKTVWKLRLVYCEKGKGDLSPAVFSLPRVELEP